jgi:dipeptidase D
VIKTSVKAISELEPRAVWKIFYEITKIPRCSGKEQRLQEWIKNWAEENGLGFKQDEVGNILLTREASTGYENLPVLTLQGHQDMVCEKDADSPHDFDKDPIPVKIESGVVGAKGTSLGADNGIGMAIGMALLNDRNLKKHGKLEALLTVEEETGLTGAVKMQKGFFSGKRMINLDSEELGIIIVGSAGGGGTQYTISVTPKAAEGSTGLRLEVDGLLGGHSGVDIHLPRLNANKLIGEGLKEVMSKVPVRIMRIEGGTRGNAIPRSAYCEFLVPATKLGTAKKILEGWQANLDRSVEKDLKVKVSEVPVGKASTEGQTKSIVGVINEVQQGPFSWSKEIEGLVQTSNNIGIVRTEEGKVVIPISSRSSDADDLEKNRAILKALGEKYGAEVAQGPGYPGWKADVKSPFLDLVSRIYQKVMGKRPKVTAIHAGLECGFLSRFDKDLKIVSIGPTIHHPHSPQEKVEIESVGVLWNVVRVIAEELENE